MSITDWLSLSLLCLAGAVSPGPSMAVVLGACLNGGRTAGLVASWAHAVGIGLYACLTVLGISALLTASPNILTAIQLLGGLYLLWLAYGLWTSTGLMSNPQPAASAARDGFAVVFLNPKVAVFMLALFSQFLQPGAALAVKLQMAGTAFFIDGAWYSLIALLFTRQSFIQRLRDNAITINRLFALALALLALALFVSLVRAALGGN